MVGESAGHASRDLVEPVEHGDRPPEVSVLIVNYNSGQRLTECVASVAVASTPVEIFVADNGSSDQSVEFLERAHPDLDAMKILRFTENLGFARAVNKMLSEARSDYVLLLNPDTVVQSTTMAKVVAALRSAPEAGMAGCLIRDPDGTEQAGCRRLVPTPWRSFVRVSKLFRVFSHDKVQSFNLMNEPLPRQPVAVEAISGAFMMVRRSAIDNVGPLDEEYFLHCEDLDWCMRFRQCGYQILFVPDGEIVHFKGTCSARHPIFVEREKHKGMIRFYRKFFRHQYPEPMMHVVVAAVWVRFAAKVLQLTLGKALGRRP